MAFTSVPFLYPMILAFLLWVAWIDIVPNSFRIMADHSMHQPGRPRFQGDSPPGSPFLIFLRA